MALILSDRVKETTVTQGTGSVTLGGSTFGGFRTFSDGIGEGNTTYYCIQNDASFEIGIGTFSSGTLSRDTILESSNSNAKISIAGVAVVFCVIPADKLFYKDEQDNVSLSGNLSVQNLYTDYISASSGDFSGYLTSDSLTSPTISSTNISTTDISTTDIDIAGDAGLSGLLTLRRESAGNFFHAYVDNNTDRTISLYSDNSSSPLWRLGLKNSPTNETEAPSYGYIFAGDGEFGIVGNSDNKVTMSNAQPFCVQHQGENVIIAHYLTGIHLNSMTSAFPALVVNGGISLSANIQEWDTYDGTTLSVVDNQGFFGIRNNNPSYQLDVTGTGNFSQAIRFGDGTLQTTAALPYSSGSLIDQNAQDIITQSGYFQTYIDSLDHTATAVSGWADYYITTTSGNLQGQIGQLDSDLSTASGALRDAITQNSDNISATSGYFESRVDSADSYALASSGYFESRSDSADADIATVSGLLTPSGEYFDFTNNILTYNNSYGGSFTADLSSLSTFDTSGVSLNYSAGTLTYTNNAGGTIDVDLSSISGDVYAMIVDGAPTTLDTLNEIAAALNDDANVANTLTTLITNTSGNLQAQIIGNDIDISTVSGLLYGHWTVSDGANSENIYAGETVSFSGVGGTIVSYDNLTNIVSISGASDPTGVVSGIAFFGNDGVLTGNGTLTYDGQNIEVDGFITASGERVITSEDIFHIVQLTQAEYDAITPDSATFYIITDASEDAAISGYFEARDTAISGYFEGATSQLSLDILTVSGLTPTGNPSGVTFFADDGSLSGNDSFTFDGQNITLDGYINASGQRVITSPTVHHIVQLTQAEYDAITPDSATFYIITDAPSISGYFEPRVTQNELDIITVSGLTPTGVPSGLTFFADDASLTGNNTLTYDGNNITLVGNITASGKRVITSDEINHIKQLTQAEYDALTPDPATFYIITDSEVEGPIQYPIRTVYSDTSIQLTDYSLLAGSGLNFTLPSAVGNRGTLFNIKNVSAGTVIVSGVGGETIDGALSYSMSTQYQTLTVQSDNSNWVII